jgi:hypothetical protein
MTAREGSKARKMPGNFETLYMPVPASRSSHTKVTAKLRVRGEPRERMVRYILGAKANDRREVPSGCERKRATKKACQG